MQHELCTGCSSQLTNVFKATVRHHLLLHHHYLQSSSSSLGPSSTRPNITKSTLRKNAKEGGEMIFWRKVHFYFYFAPSPNKPLTTSANIWHVSLCE